MTISLLLTLRHILFALNQLLKVFKSLLTCLLLTLIELLKCIRFMSSEKLSTLQNLIEYGDY